MNLTYHKATIDPSFTQAIQELNLFYLKKTPINIKVTREGLKMISEGHKAFSESRCTSKMESKITLLTSWPIDTMLQPVLEISHAFFIRLLKKADEEEAFQDKEKASSQFFSLYVLPEEKLILNNALEFPLDKKKFQTTFRLKEENGSGYTQFFTNKNKNDENDNDEIIFEFDCGHLNVFSYPILTMRV